MFIEDGRESAISNDKDDDSLTAVDFVGESSLLKIIVVNDILKEVFKHVNNIVGGDDGSSSGKGEEEEKRFGSCHGK